MNYSTLSKRTLTDQEHAKVIEMLEHFQLKPESKSATTLFCEKMNNIIDILELLLKKP